MQCPVREGMLSDRLSAVPAEFTFSIKNILLCPVTQPPPPWQIDLARLEGALPFLPPPLEVMLAQRSLRRLWAIHVRDYPFESYGVSYDPGLAANELMRSFYATERTTFLSWIARRAPPPLAQAATIALAAKGTPETFASDFKDADRALDRLDALLPARDPLTALVTLVDQLIREEVAFLEGSSESYLAAGQAFSRPAARGAAWAASLAVAMRPHLFSLGEAPFALTGLAPRAAFRSLREHPIPIIITESLAASVRMARVDLDACRIALEVGTERLGQRYSSSRAPDVWHLLIGLGPLTRAEIARGLAVTKRTASQTIVALKAAELVQTPGRHDAITIRERYEDGRR